MLNQLRLDLERAAALAPEYKRDSRSAEMINAFADKYCEALDSGDEANKNIYYSCLLLKFWDRITGIFDGRDKNYGEQIKFLIANKQIEIEDIFSKVCECIDTAMRYRTWQDASKKTTAQACINQIISSRAAGELLRPFNLKKNEGKVFKKSLDDPIGLDDKSTLLDTCQSNDEFMRDQAVIDIIQKAIDSNKIIEAIIFDNIAFNDCQKQEKERYKSVDSETGEESEHSRTISSFWAYKLVKELNALGESYKDYFLRSYDIQEEKLSAALESIKASSNSKLYSSIESAKRFGRSLLS